MRRTGVLSLVLFALAAAAAGGANAPRLLYSDNGDLYVSAADGSGRVALTEGTHQAAPGQWSPDGTRIAFATNRDTAGRGGSEIYVVNADGTGRTRLTFGASTAGNGKYAPIWSPDGSRIAFAYALGVWSVPANGGTATRIADTPVAAFPVAWSPDGSTILALGQQGAGDLFYIRVSDGSVHDLGRLQTPAYSPDGSRIAYQDAQGRLAVMNADTTDVRELTDMTAREPSWVDDRTVVFRADHVYLDQPETKFGYPVRTNLYLLDVDSQDVPRRVTGAFDEYADYRSADLPQVAPGGAQMLFRWDSGLWWRSNVDGTCAEPLPIGIGSTASWQPGSPVAATRCSEVWIGPGSSVSPNPVALGQPGIVSVQLENHGNEPATNVRVTLTPVDAASRVGYCSSCSFASIAPGATAVARFSLFSKLAGYPRADVEVTSDQPALSQQLTRATFGVEVLNCTLVGTTGRDRLVGTPRADRICGLPGPDWINGGAGDDTIDSGNGDDVVYGGPGRDTISTRDGRDVVFAADGARDTIDCGGWYDTAVVDRFDVTRHCEHVVRVR